MAMKVQGAPTHHGKWAILLTTGAGIVRDVVKVASNRIEYASGGSDKPSIMETSWCLDEPAVSVSGKMQARLFECKQGIEVFCGVELADCRLVMNNSNRWLFDRFRDKWVCVLGNDGNFDELYTDFRYIDTPAAEWLGPERLGEFVGQMLAFDVHSGLGTFGVLSYVADNDYAVGECRFRVGNLKRFCPITLPPEPSPPAPERDVWEQFAAEAFDAINDNAPPGFSAKVNRSEAEAAIAQVVREHFAPLQAERDELKRECTELRQEVERLKKLGMELAAKEEEYQILQSRGKPSEQSVPEPLKPEVFRVRPKKSCGHPVRAVSFGGYTFVEGNPFGWRSEMFDEEFNRIE